MQAKRAGLPPPGDTQGVDEHGLPVVELGPGEVVSDGKAIGGQAYQFRTEYAPRPAPPTPDEVLDPRVESPATRAARKTVHERSRIPNWVRQDLVRYHQEVAAQNRPYGARDLAPNGVPWNDLGAAREHFGMPGQQEPHVYPAFFTNPWDNQQGGWGLQESEMVNDNLFYRRGR